MASFSIPDVQDNVDGWGPDSNAVPSQLQYLVRKIALSLRLRRAACTRSPCKFRRRWRSERARTVGEHAWNDASLDACILCRGHCSWLTVHHVHFVFFALISFPLPLPLSGLLSGPCAVLRAAQPFAPFSKSDRVGRACEWNYTRDRERNRHWQRNVGYGKEGEPSPFVMEQVDEEGFHLVEQKTPAKPKWGPQRGGRGGMRGGMRCVYFCVRRVRAPPCARPGAFVFFLRICFAGS